MESETIAVHEENVLLAVIVRDTPQGGIDAHIKGYMDPAELIDFLREIADHLEQNGPVDG